MYYVLRITKQFIRLSSFDLMTLSLIFEAVSGHIISFFQQQGKKPGQKLKIGATYNFYEISTTLITKIMLLL